MKKDNKKVNSKLVDFSCIACSSSFSAYSTLPSSSVKTDICSNCSPFFTGSSSSEIRVGKVEAFYKKQEKAIDNKTKSK